MDYFAAAIARITARLYRRAAAATKIEQIGGFFFFAGVSVTNDGFKAAVGRKKAKASFTCLLAMRQRRRRRL